MKRKGIEMETCGNIGENEEADALEDFKKRAQGIARNLGVFYAARYLAKRHIGLETALEWLCGKRRNV